MSAAVPFTPERHELLRRVAAGGDVSHAERPLALALERDGALVWRVGGMFSLTTCGYATLDLWRHRRDHAREAAPATAGAPC